MASADSLRMLRELQARPENKSCVDCNTKNPQVGPASLPAAGLQGAPLSPSKQRVRG